MGKHEWKTLKGFKDIQDYRYQVSKYGDVREKYSKRLIHKKIANKKHHPYYAAYLKNVDNVGKWILVHQLVGHCWVKMADKYKNEPISNMVPDHLDNNGLNNYYKNLEWKTRGENVRKAFQNKEIDHSCDKGRDAIITNEQAEQICKYLENRLSYDEIIEKMNFPNDKSHRTLLVRIKNKIAWNEISDKYKFDKDTIQYTAVQRETISKIPDMFKLHKAGLKAGDIARALWPNADSKKLNTKRETVKLVLKFKVFKEVSTRLIDQGKLDIQIERNL